MQDLCILLLLNPEDKPQPTVSHHAWQPYHVCALASSLFGAGQVEEEAQGCDSVPFKIAQRRGALVSNDETIGI
jgi:hypothetical protein